MNSTKQNDCQIGKLKKHCYHPRTMYHLFRAVLMLLLILPAPVSASPKVKSKTISAPKKAVPQKRPVTAKAERKVSAADTSAASGSSRIVNQRAVRPLQVYGTEDGGVVLNQIPKFSASLVGKAKSMTVQNQFIFYTFDPELQNLAEKLIAKARAPHVAIVAMEPQTGRLLAIAQKSKIYPDLALHAGFPAASLFKVVTTCAAVEKAHMQPEHEVTYRGGVYALNELNFRPDARRDTLSMSVTEALGRSCNPVFGRVALQYIPPKTLLAYANLFGFNSPLPFDAPLPLSTAAIPETDYEYSRTGAGFGAVTVSPVHAAALMAGIANGGLQPRPWMIERVVSAQGKLLYDAHPSAVRRMMREDTAKTVMDMMEASTTVGTCKREFQQNKSNRMKHIRVAAKTGTLRGEDPRGLNHWFIAAAPIENPKIALAIIAVDGGSLDSKPSHLGRLLMENYLL